ncbi:hypothetical protein B7R87_25335 [Streptomyces tsukubensis]|nr:hypothetical protein B7R87_25335 [Streptomyces tsukubensis]
MLGAGRRPPGGVAPLRGPSPDGGPGASGGGPGTRNRRCRALRAAGRPELRPVRLSGAAPCGAARRPCPEPTGCPASRAPQGRKTAVPRPDRLSHVPSPAGPQSDRAPTRPAVPVPSPARPPGDRAPSRPAVPVPSPGGRGTSAGV